MSEPEITNPEKTEKPKNPKRVEQGKRLAAISREAKERKKQTQEEFFEPKEPEWSAEGEGNKIFFGIGLIGAAFLVYKIFFDSKKSKEDAQQPEETRKVTVAPEEREATPEENKDTPPKPAESFAPPPRKPQGKTRGYEPYTMD